MTTNETALFGAVLVANRGEIAVRVIGTLRRLGIRSIAVHTDADARARHVREADEAIRIPSHLDAAAVIEAAAATGAQAIHPGYGFLAENAGFARACAAAGLVFIGPPADAIEAMGDKIRAKNTVAAAGVPVVPGSAEPGLSDAALAEAALAAGLADGAPVLLKPSAGGGGKGMVPVHDAADLGAAIDSARRQARAAFGDDTLLVERYVRNPRHIEIQVFADAHGSVVHLGERECSLQRRHQKIVEEAPSPLLDEAARARMGAAAVAAARAVGYVGAGTVEYIVSADSPGEFFFMEMNTRLQVEHPVTELAITIDGGAAPAHSAHSAHPAGGGLDLVELQLRVAAGEPLPFGQDAVRFTGHAIEARVYAEDPARGFLPTGGRVLAVAEPGAARVDSGIAVGDVVGSAYDPMLAKVIARGTDRAAALAALDRALGEYALLGVPTNAGFLRALLAHPDVRAGRLDTGLVERSLDDLIGGDLAVPAAVLAAAALERMLGLDPGDAADPWDVPDGWRPGGAAWTTWLITAPGRAPAEVRVRGRAGNAEVSVDGAEPVRARAEFEPGTAGGHDGAAARHGRAPAGGRPLTVTWAGRTFRYLTARDDDGTLWITRRPARDGAVWALREHVRGAAEPGAATGGAADGVVRSPMPGTVLTVSAAEGDTVAAGAPLLVVEAMKMEHTVTAPVGGVLARLKVRAGSQVALDEVLAEIEETP